MRRTFNRRAADIILVAPTTWSTIIMTDDRETCVDLYLDSFAQSFAAANYTLGTIRTYRHLVNKLGRLMDAAGIAPSALPPAVVNNLGQREGGGRDPPARSHPPARGFVDHLT